MKDCPRCKHYGCLVNQGYWWCNLQLDMDNENCEACDTSLYDNAVITTYSSSTYDEKPKIPSTTPKQYGEHLMRTGKNKKKRTR